MNQNSHLFDVKISDLMLNQVSDVKLGTMEAEKWLGNPLVYDNMINI